MTRRWWTLLVVPCLAAMAAGCQQAQPATARPTPIAVYEPPITRNVLDFEEFPGETDSPYSVQVRARVSGYMTQVYFRDGIEVRKGDKLFEIDPRMYKADLDRAEGTVAQYKAHVERLQKEYNRAKNLLGRGSISQEEHDRYKADYEEAEANLKVAVANRDLAQLNLEWTEVTSPIDGLLSRRMVDPGNLIKADDTVLTSVVSLDPLYVYFDVHEQAMLRIKRLILEGKFRVKAQGIKAVPVQIGLSDETGFPHQGIVDFTDNRVDLNTGTLRFRARIDNPADSNGNRFIVPGLFVKVRLPIGEEHPALMVREQALVTDQGRKTVYVIVDGKDKDGKPLTDKDGKPVKVAEVRDVGAVGVLRDGFREVEKGVNPGDWVVVAGMQRLRPGAVVMPELFKDPSGGKPAGQGAGKPVATSAPAGLAAHAGEAARPKTAETGPGKAPAPAAAGAGAKPDGNDPWTGTKTVPAGKGGGRSRESSRAGH